MLSIHYSAHMCMIQLQLSKLLLSFIKISLICFCSTKHVKACCSQSLLRCDKRKEAERRRSFKVFVFFTVLGVSCASSSFSSHKVVEVFRRVTAGCEDGTHFPLWAGPILSVHHFFLWFIDWWTCFSKMTEFQSFAAFQFMFCSQHGCLQTGLDFSALTLV